MTENRLPSHRRPSYRSISGWPALLVISVLIAGVLYLTLARHDPAAQLKPATGAARAMALAAETPAHEHIVDRETPTAR